MKGQAAILTAAGIGATLIFLLGSNWVGLLGGFLNFLTPVPAAWLSMRYGMRSGLVVVIVTSLLLWQLSAMYALLAYVGLFGIGSLLLPYSLRRDTPWDRSLILAVFGSALASAAMVAALIVVSGTSLPELVDKAIEVQTSEAMRIYRDIGITGEQLQEMEASLNGLAVQIRDNIYGLYLGTLLGIHALCLLCLQLFRAGHYRIVGGPFIQWRLPQKLIWGLIAGGFLAVIPVAGAKGAGWAILSVLLPLYFLQGLAVISFLMQRNNTSLLVKGLFYALTVILYPLSLIVTSVGVFDLWIDFRRPRQKNN
ncbi:MAG: hypothetical protein C0622_00780 [Desulfuromonas sp.]|nr:MAG: hypothetical protein C0622_00780 [Desulfuromonas sp.]